MYHDVKLCHVQTLIPRKLHLIWIGDANKRPNKCIESWKRNHPGWQFKVWTDADLAATAWINQALIEKFAEAEDWPGVADLMRYEILYREGGVYVDADSFSLRPLDNWLLENEMFACWEDTLAVGRDRLVSNAFLGSVAGNGFWRFLIETIKNSKDHFRRWSWGRMRYVKQAQWKSVGPGRLTECIYAYERAGNNGMAVLPSHMFCPNHHHGQRYRGRGIMYADHKWANTRDGYDGLTV